MNWHSNLVIAELLQRFYKKTSLEFEEEILLYSSLLKQIFCFDINAEYVNFEQMSSDDFYNGTHLNECGIKLYVKCVKMVLNPILGVHTKLNTKNEGRKMRIWMTRDFYDKRGNKKYDHVVTLIAWLALISP